MPNLFQSFLANDVISSIEGRTELLSRSIAKGAGGAPETLLSNYVWKAGPNKLAAAQLKAAKPDMADDDDGSIPFTLSTADEDRDGDLVYPKGCYLDNYANNPGVYFGHQDWEVPIGTSRNPRDKRLMIFPEENRIWGVCYFDRADEDADFIYGKVKRGFLNAASIAFVPLEAYRRDHHERKARIDRDRHDDPHPGWVFMKYDLTEWSIVGVPANAGAIRDALDREKSFISPRLQKALTQYAAKPKGKSFSGPRSKSYVRRIGFPQGVDPGLAEIVKTGTLEGKPCKPGQSSARTGCVPRSGKPGGKKPAAQKPTGEKPQEQKPQGEKKPTRSRQETAKLREAAETHLSGLAGKIAKGESITPEELETAKHGMQFARVPAIKKTLEAISQGKASGTKAVLSGKALDAIVAKVKNNPVPPGPPSPETREEAAQKLDNAKAKVGFTKQVAAIKDIREGGKKDKSTAKKALALKLAESACWAICMAGAGAAVAATGGAAGVVIGTAILGSGLGWNGVSAAAAVLDYKEEVRDIDRETSRREQQTDDFYRRHPQERRLSNSRQKQQGGENEAELFSPDELRSAMETQLQTVQEAATGSKADDQQIEVLESCLNDDQQLQEVYKFLQDEYVSRAEQGVS